MIKCMSVVHCDTTNSLFVSISTISSFLTMYLSDITWFRIWFEAWNFLRSRSSMCEKVFLRAMMFLVDANFVRTIYKLCHHCYARKSSIRNPLPFVTHHSIFFFTRRRCYDKLRIVFDTFNSFEARIRNIFLSILKTIKYLSYMMYPEMNINDR